MADNQYSNMEVDGNESTTLSSSSASTSKLPRLRVLSLFDGIGTGYYSLLQLKFDIEVIYASEIDKDALMLTKHHFPEIIHLGSVTEITTEMLDQISPINLLIGGSPCADLSGVNHRKKGLFNPEGTGILFFDYYRIWNYLSVKAAKKNSPFYWLFENVASMEVKNKDTISKYFECRPVVVDSLHISPQRRRRYFWTGFPEIKRLTQDSNMEKSNMDEPRLEDYLDKKLDRQANVEKIGTITSKRSCLQDSKSRNPVCQDGQYTGLFITEIEVIFGLPKHFTDVGDLSISSRQKLLGRAWSVQVINDLLNLLSDKFAKKRFTTKSILN